MNQNAKLAVLKNAAIVCWCIGAALSRVNEVYTIAFMGLSAVLAMVWILMYRKI